MSKRMKAKRFSETFYQHDLVLVPTRKSWERLCRLSLADPHAILPTGISGHVLNTEWNDGGHAIVVWIDRDPQDKSVAARAGVIAHEAAHAARMILDNIGETERTWEVEPYLVGDIAAAIWEMHHA